MSEWIDNFVKQMREEIVERQIVIDALIPPKPRRKRRKKVAAPLTPEQRELTVNLRTSTAGIRPQERELIVNGDRELAYVTTGGEQDG